MGFQSFIAAIGKIQTIEEARLKLLQIAPHLDLEKAINRCVSSHDGIFRKTGEPYVVHPLLVAALVAFYGGDHVLIQSALLHDVVEDTNMELDEIEKEFGPDVRAAVDGVTKIKEIRKEQLIPSTSEEKLHQSASTFHKMLLRSIDNVGVLIIKLCDRMHNIMTLNGLEPRKQKRIAEETLYVYAPIAHKLGISNMRNFLENHAFPYALPLENMKIQKYLDSQSSTVQKALDRFMTILNNLMIENGFSTEPFQVNSSVKHNFSIYEKTLRQGIDVKDVIDLYRVRVLVENELSCYIVLGIVHLNFKPFLDRFKDHISFSKDNGYQTLHAMVNFEKLNIEIQIRTFDMHKTAEYGITASWKYSRVGLLPNLDWLQRTEKEPKRLEQFYQEAKTDLSAKDIVVSTPTGRPITLPVGSLALDYAYHIHSDLGNFAKLAYINGRSSSIFSRLRNGDTVRIEEDRDQEPRILGSSRVRTAHAKKMLILNNRRRKNAIHQRQVLRVLAGFFDLDPDEIERFQEKWEIRFDASRVVQEPLLQADLIKKFQKKMKDSLPPQTEIHKLRWKEQEVDQFFVRFFKKVRRIYYSECCHPSWGSEILGIQKGKYALEMHDLSCEKTFSQLSRKKPMAFVRWADIERKIYFLRVSLQKNEIGSMARFLHILADYRIRLRSVRLQDHPSRVGYCDLKIETEILDLEMIQKIVSPHAKIVEIREVGSNLKPRVFEPNLTEPE